MIESSLFYDYLKTELATRVGFAFEKVLGRYRNLQTGQFVSEQALIGVVEEFSEDFLINNLDRITDDLLSGKLTLASWQEKFARELKEAYVVAGSVGRGGRRLMDFSDFGRIGGHLRFEYRHLNQFAQEIKLGILSPAQIKARARSYAHGVRSAYWEARRRALQVAGKTLERRVLRPAEHCIDCIGYANRGWQPIGTFPPPGIGSQCLHGCRCEMEWK